MVKEYADAFRAEGMKVMLYYSILDTHARLRPKCITCLLYTSYIEATKKANGLLPNDNPRLYNPYLSPALDWADNLFNDWGHNRRGNINIRGGVPNANYYASLRY